MEKLNRTKTYIMCLMTDELNTFYKYRKKYGSTRWSSWRKEDRMRVLMKYRNYLIGINDENTNRI